MRIEIKNLILQYLSECNPDLVVDNLSFSCPVAILGGGGSGKTNLLKVLSGVEYIKSGQIYFDEVEIGALPPKKRNIAMLCKDTQLIPNKTVEFNLALPLKKRKLALNKECLPTDIAAILHKKVAQLSHEERIDLLLARVWLRNPDLILIDEPAAFCPEPDLFLEKAVKMLDPSKLVLATYDFESAAKLCSSFVLLRHGRVIFCGNSEQLAQQADLDPYIKAFLG